MFYKMSNLYDSGDSDEKNYAPSSRDILHPVISDRKDSFFLVDFHIS